MRKPAIEDNVSLRSRMHHYLFADDRLEPLETFIRETCDRSAVRTAAGILVQLFWDTDDLSLAGQVVARIRARLPSATIVGARAAAQICEGRVRRDCVTVSISAFAHTHVEAAVWDAEPGEEAAVASAILARFGARPDLRALLLLAPPFALDCARLLDRLDEGTRHVDVFGGGAALCGAGQITELLCDDEFHPCAVVAVALSGTRLRVECHVAFGWKALGPTMKLTDVDGSLVRAIDGRPAIEVYRRYLAIDAGDMYLLEFPLLTESSGRTIARNPVAAEPDGALRFVADVRPGETFRLGYADVDEVLACTDEIRRYLHAFTPETIFAYSCVCRFFALNDDAELETLPLQALAPTAGFYTAGEFCRTSGRLRVLNSTQVVVALSEREPEIPLAPCPPLPRTIDSFRLRHMRSTSRLVRFIGAITEKLEEANEALRAQAERDPLTGAFNRRVFDERMSAELARAERTGSQVSVVLIDLDRFKSINDNWGHQAGDQVLRQTATALQETIRASDVLCRYGGEEFALIMPETASTLAAAVADRLRRTIAEQRLFDRTVELPPVTASFGVASSPEQGQDTQSLIAAADAALYRAKALGRDRVVVAGEPRHSPGDPGRSGEPDEL